MRNVALAISLFILAGLAEIGGGWLVWQWLREGRSMRLTQAGEYLLAVANRVLPQFAMAEERVRQFASGVLFIGEGGKMLLADYGRHVLLPEAEFKDFERPAPETTRQTVLYVARFFRVKPITLER